MFYTVPLRGCALLLFFTSVVFADTVETQQLTPLSATAGAYFGRAVAVYNDTLAVGVPRDDDEADNAGSVYVYSRVDGAWNNTQEIHGSDASADANFGIDVALDDETLVVGAYWDGENGYRSGAAYVFVEQNGTWTEQAKLTASDGAAEDWFGSAVAVEGDTVVVGAPSKNADVGAFYVFTRSGTTWTEQDVVDGDTQIQTLGAALAIDNGTLVVGALGYHSDFSFGGAFVYAVSGGTATVVQELQPKKRLYLYSGLGAHISISGDWIALGAEEYDPQYGRVYLYHLENGVWTEGQKLQFALTGGLSDEFGAAVAMTPAHLVVGATYGESADAGRGAAFVFTESGGTWTQAEKLVASDGFMDDNFGYAVAADGPFIAIGAYNYELEDSEVNNTGAVYAFGNEPLMGDVNGDDAVNAADIQMVINAVLGLASGPENADIDGNSVVDAVDIQLVINAVLGV